ncbi:MAG: hypothetical protein HOV68_25265, partial [Streptomycetaceae bacterium]|nr:hypothetical protein [Streptomycetaceae bacterium]
MSTARGLRRTGRGGPVRTAARLTAVLTAIILLSGCTLARTNLAPVTVQEPLGYSGNGALDPAKLPERARQWEQWINKAGSICPEATPLIVAG